MAGLLIAGRQKGKKASKGKKTGRMRDKKDPLIEYFLGESLLARSCEKEAL